KIRGMLQKIAVFLRVGSTHAGDTTTTAAVALADPLLPQSAPVTDLTLSVQELAKLRSSGRTRRYEVLARSRDGGRDEVPAAFVSESAKGRDGAALDEEVLRQLFAWLKEHPQIWDGEPASFSINLSIGALEDERFVEGIAASLKAGGIPPENIG